VFDTVQGNSIPEKIENMWQRLQQHVSAVIDSDSQKFTTKDVGIRQMLEKKEGRLLLAKYFVSERKFLNIFSNHNGMSFM